MRIKNLIKMMEKENIDYTIIGPTSNMFYLTQFSDEQMERPLLLIVGKNETYFVAPKIYEEQLSKTGIEIKTYNDGEDPYSKINIPKGPSLSIDDQLWSIFLINIINKISPSDIIPASKLMSRLRAVKEEEEIEIMRKGLNIAEKSFMEFLNKIEEGKTECELAKELKDIFYDNGADNVSFEPIVTSGSNTSMPHLRCTNRKVKNGDIIIADFGVKYQGYSTDTTRVISIGKPPEEVLRVYNIVKDAQESAENAIKGMTGKEIDSLARNVISNKSFGEYFIHRTGHGIGIDVHEEPYISQDYNEKITNNMTFTIEPGIYLPEKFGIRIEDMVVMKDKAVVMNSLEKEIFIV